MAEAEGETLWELRDELERVRRKVEAKKREEATNGGARYSRAYGRVAVRSILGASEKDLCSWIGKEISVGGWVRNGRLAERNAKVFVELNDGLILHSLQCIATSDV
jgi:asparaginyl-tRNA synthetase